MHKSLNPVIIQGGMGAGVSDWRLARAVAQTGQLGVVSGTALDTILARRLQCGDLDGAIRRALDDFPHREMADKILERYFIAGGKEPDAPFRSTSVVSLPPKREQLELIVVSNFVEVYLAKEDHTGPVGINYLEKIQMPILPSLLGAMLSRSGLCVDGCWHPTAHSWRAGSTGGSATGGNSDFGFP